MFSLSLFVNISLFFSSQHALIDALEKDDILRQEMPHAGLYLHAARPYGSQEAV